MANVATVVGELKRRIAFATLLLVAALVAGCASRATYQPLPPVNAYATIEPGDTFDLEIVGEEKLPKSYTVAPNGSVSIPYINEIKVDGLQQQEIAARIKERLIALDIRTDDPTVVVSNCTFKTKRVEVVGEVMKPGSLPFESNMGLVRAIVQAGWFTATANRDQITVLRRLSKTKVVKAVIPFNRVTDNRIADPPLQPGDVVVVASRPF